MSAEIQPNSSPINRVQIVENLRLGGLLEKVHRYAPAAQLFPTLLTEQSLLPVDSESYQRFLQEQKRIALLSSQQLILQVRSCCGDAEATAEYQKLVSDPKIRGKRSPGEILDINATLRDELAIEADDLYATAWYGGKPVQQILFRKEGDDRYIGQSQSFLFYPPGVNTTIEVRSESEPSSTHKMIHSLPVKDTLAKGKKKEILSIRKILYPSGEVHADPRVRDGGIALIAKIENPDVYVPEYRMRTAGELSSTRFFVEERFPLPYPNVREIQVYDTDGVSDWKINVSKIYSTDTEIWAEGVATSYRLNPSNDFFASRKRSASSLSHFDLPANQVIHALTAESHKTTDVSTVSVEGNTVIYTYQSSGHTLVLSCLQSDENGVMPIAAFYANTRYSSEAICVNPSSLSIQTATGVLVVVKDDDNFITKVTLLQG